MSPPLPTKAAGGEGSRGVPGTSLLNDANGDADLASPRSVHLLLGINVIWLSPCSIRRTWTTATASLITSRS